MAAHQDCQTKFYGKSCGNEEAQNNFKDRAKVPNVSKFAARMDAFLRQLNAVYHLPEPARQAFLAQWKPMHHPKGHALVREGGVCNHLFYVSKGLVRIYYHKRDREITEWLAPDDSFFFSIRSFFERTPSRLIIHLLEPSELLAIRHGDLMRLCDQYHEVEKLFRRMITGSLVLSQMRMESLQFETARQRYQTLLEQFPTLLQRVPLAYIASFLGITQETLSRIRAGR